MKQDPVAEVIRTAAPPMRRPLVRLFRTLAGRPTLTLRIPDSSPRTLPLLAALALLHSSFAPALDFPGTLDLRQPMALAAKAIPPRLDPKLDFRPWFLLRGSNSVPTTPAHDTWDLGDTTGRYLESLIMARHMGITAPELSHAEERLQRYLFSLLGTNGLVINPDSGASDHSFSQGSALLGLLALYQDSADPTVRTAIERLITAQLKRAERQGELLVDPTVKLAQSSGSHLAGYQIYPAIRFYEMTGYQDALALARGLSRWALSDPTLGPQGEITKALSWEGHIHSWLETLAGCVRFARVTHAPDLDQVVERARRVYDWVRRSNATPFGWIATYPTGGSSETCAISSAIRLALELAATGATEYLDDVERFARNQLVEAQFTDLKMFETAGRSPTPLLLGCFDSQSMPNRHLGTRGGEDVGTVEGCCLNGGMRALYLAWNASQAADESGVTVNLAINRSGPAADVLSYHPLDGRVDITPRVPGSLWFRLPPWADRKRTSASINGRTATNRFDRDYLVIDWVPRNTRVSIRYPLRDKTEEVRAGGQTFRATWRGTTVIKMEPESKTNPLYQGRTKAQRNPSWSTATPTAQDPYAIVPDTWELQDAARLASFSMLARLDVERELQPFFRIYPLAKPPFAQHEKWDDGDLSGRYVEALSLTRRITGARLDARETGLRTYLLRLFDFADGLCYTRPTEWTPRRADLFSQSSAMMGLLAWHKETGSPEARKLLDWQVDGLMRIAERRGNYVLFPKYEYDGARYVDEPQGKDAPPWYAGRLICPMVEYWQLTHRQDVAEFLDKFVAYCTAGTKFIGPNGEVEQGEGWWGHLHGTMDMAAGIAEFGRLSKRPDLVDWARRVYDWVGRTQTTSYGFVADVSGGRNCESCGIGSRIRLGLALYRAGAADPFGEIDRHLRNQLLENQFADLPWMVAEQPQTPRTGQKAFAGIGRMIRGTFQCWSTANDLIGNDDIEGCGAGGGVQAIALALGAQADWNEIPAGKELRIHLLFNRQIRGAPQPPFTTAAPVAAELMSSLPFEGRVVVRAHELIDRLALRLPDHSDATTARTSRTPPRIGAAALVAPRRTKETPQLAGRYVLISSVKPGEEIRLDFDLVDEQTKELAAGKEYRARWKGSSVVGLAPAGNRVPLYAGRESLRKTATAPAAGTRY